MKIYLIRHGESASDLVNKYGGAHDDELTNKGISQAKEPAKLLYDAVFLLCRIWNVKH